MHASLHVLVGPKKKFQAMWSYVERPPISRFFKVCFEGTPKNFMKPHFLAKRSK